MDGAPAARRNTARLPARRIVVMSGPGGVGKGTIVDRLVAADDRLVVSRSWTTRAPRPGEPADAYVFTNRQRFEDRIASGGFFEWNEFLGELYGTPRLDPSDERDVVLEIDVNGAANVKRAEPAAILIFVVAPSLEDQAARLRARGDDDARVAARLAAGVEEEQRGRAMYDYVVVNDDLDRAVAEVASILEAHRSHPTP